MATASARVAVSIAAADKENVAPAIPMGKGGVARRKGLSTITLGAGHLANVLREGGGNADADASRKNPVTSCEEHALPRLLLFAERADEVFMLGEGLPESEARRELAQAVMEDRGNPSVWWHLLQHVHRVFGESESCAPAEAAHIRKFYQKATRIIPDGPSRDKEDPALVNIWLGFAAAENCVSESDAREAYEHMYRCGIGSRSSSFYLKFAAFEEKQGRITEALALLESGISRGAAPLETLVAELERLRSRKPLVASRIAAPLPSTFSTRSPPSVAPSPDLTIEASGVADRDSGTQQPHPSQPPRVEEREHDRARPGPPSAPAAAVTETAKAPVPPAVTPQAQPTGTIDASMQQQAGILSPTPASARADLLHSSHKDDSTNQGSTRTQPRTVSKSKRLLPTGRLLGLGKAERVRFDTPGKADGEAEKVTGGGGSKCDADFCPPPPEKCLATPSTGSAEAHAPVPVATTPAKPDTHRLQDLRLASPSLTALHPILEGDQSAGKEERGSEDTAHGQQASVQQTPGETAFRPLAAKTPHLNSARATLPPPSLACLPSPAAASSRSSDSPKEDLPGSGRKQKFDTDEAHTRDRGRVSAVTHESVQKEDKGSLDDDGKDQKRAIKQQQEELQTPLDHYSRRHEQQPRRHTEEGIREDKIAGTPASRNAGAPLQLQDQPHHYVSQHPQSHRPSPSPFSRPEAQPPHHHAPPPSQHQQEHQEQRQQQQRETRSKHPEHLQQPASQTFSFDTLLSSRNFMTLNNTQYLRLDVLGRGGSSKVYRVLSESGQIYALKRVRVPPKDRKALESFANEITLLARLRGHPCIIQLIDSTVDKATGLVLMLMELGEIDLSKLLAEQAAAEALDAGNDSRGKGRRPLSLNFVRFVWEQMLRAVHCVHEERIVHGDLKPANFVFVRGRLKLIDFGIAKAIGNDTTNIMRESQVGTVNYMSPEAILDTGNGREQPGAGGRRAPCMKIGRASDVWSLGCILYQLVYGKTPFADLNLIQKLHCIVDERYQIAFPDDELHFLDPDVRDTIQQCLRRDPTARPPIAGGTSSLLQHPFLQSTGKGSDSHICQTIQATLEVLDQYPDVLTLEKGKRVGSIFERLNGRKEPLGNAKR